jgi:hypothetical protein
MQVNQISAIEIVNEFGETIRASEDVHPDLFWALRGGGGNFGVVTAMEFNLVPTPQVHAGMLLWPWEEAEAVYTTWLEMIQDLPEEFTTTCRLIQMPPFEEIPEFLRGRQIVVFNGAYLGDREDAAKLIAPLRALKPELDTFDDVDSSALAFLHMDPEDPMPYVADHMLLEMVDTETVKELVAKAGAGSGSPMAVVELRHTGGALSRCVPGHGARATLPGQMLYFTVGGLMPGLPPEALDAQAAKVRALLEPFKAEANYLNFSENAGKLADFFDPHTYERLAKVKAEYDQANVFQGNFEL